MNASGGVPGWCNESRVTCMKNYALWLCHKYDVNYMIMQWQYDKSKVCHDNEERNGGKLHGNISRDGYGNAIIGRYSGCFEEDSIQQQHNGVVVVEERGNPAGLRQAPRERRSTWERGAGPLRSNLRRGRLLEICPRGNNKSIIIIFPCS